MQPVRRILVATDFSPCADAAAALAAQLAEQLGAMVHVMTMVDTSSVMDAPGDPAYRRFRIDALHAEVQQRLQGFAERHFAELEDVRLHVVDGGADPDPGREIVRAGPALECDLILLGTHGKTGLDHLVLGSVAERVVRTSTIPVLTVRSRG